MKIEHLHHWDSWKYIDSVSHNTDWITWYIQEYTHKISAKTQDFWENKKLNNFLKKYKNKLQTQSGNIEINWDEVHILIPYYKTLVFDKNTYKFWNQWWWENDGIWQNSWWGNRFSKEDFEILLQYLGGNKVNGACLAKKNTVDFFTQVLGLKVGFNYWSSTHYNWNSAWCLCVQADIVYLGLGSINTPEPKNSAIIL